MFYTFNQTADKCYLSEKEKEKKKIIKELELVSKNSFQWKYKHEDAILTIEKKGTRIITATLQTPYELPTILIWEDKDYGRAVFDKEKKDYILKYGLPRIFYIFNDKYKEKEPWKFYFVFDWHLVLKDKDENKPYYWYYYDYTEELSNFVYETMFRYIGNSGIGEGEIVAIPGERGQATEPWSYLSHGTNEYYCGEDEEKKDYDFGKETAENWRKKNFPPRLVITFLPTYLKNYELKPKEKLTGIKWFLKIWEVFGARGVPIVLKCYPAFIHTLLFRHYRPLYEKVSSVCELPTSVDIREVGKSNYLAFFNCDFLPKRIKYEKFELWYE